MTDEAMRWALRNVQETMEAAEKTLTEARTMRLSLILAAREDMSMAEIAHELGFAGPTRVSQLTKDAKLAMRHAKADGR